MFSRISIRYCCPNLHSNNCYRSYKNKCSLGFHLKYECNKQPWHECKICHKLVHQKSNFNFTPQISTSLIFFTLFQLLSNFWRKVKYSIISLSVFAYAYTIKKKKFHALIILFIMLYICTLYTITYLYIMQINRSINQNNNNDWKVILLHCFLYFCIVIAYVNYYHCHHNTQV